MAFREALLLEKMSFTCLYVVDCLAVFKTKYESAQFHCHLNQIHPASQFTCEGIKKQIDSVFGCYGDKHGKILTTVYRKATFSGQYKKSYNNKEKLFI